MAFSQYDHSRYDRDCCAQVLRPSVCSEEMSSHGTLQALLPADPEPAYTSRTARRYTCYTARRCSSAMDILRTEAIDTRGPEKVYSRSLSTHGCRFVTVSRYNRFRDRDSTCDDNTPSSLAPIREEDTSRRLAPDRDDGVIYHNDYLHRKNVSSSMYRRTAPPTQTTERLEARCRLLHTDEMRGCFTRW
jgi:hypothetical protein